MAKPSLDKVVFVLSLAVLAWFYGFATRSRGWFPTDLLRQAWRQAQAIAPFQSTMRRPAHVQPRVYNRVGVRMVEPQEVQPGMTLIESLWEDFDWKPGLKLKDMSGRTLHEWLIDGHKLFPDPPEDVDLDRATVKGSYLFSNGDLVVNLHYVGVARLDACGRVLWRLPAGNHHSIARAEDGSFWIAGGGWETSGESRGRSKGLAGLGQRVYHDRILNVSEDGEVLNEIDVLDVLYVNGLERYIPKGSAHSAEDTHQTRDVTHLNDVEPLPASMADQYPLFAAGDLLVSLRELDLVFVFDPESKRVKWHASDPFIQQHDPDFLGSGWIGVFDNNLDGTERGTMLGGSRIVLIQPHTDSIKVVFPTQRSDPFYTDKQGEWQQLENGNLLLNESHAGRVVEVASDGRTVWEWVAEPYDEATVPEVNYVTRYDLTHEEVASWPCSPGDSTDKREDPES